MSNDTPARIGTIISKISVTQPINEKNASGQLVVDHLCVHQSGSRVAIFTIKFWLLRLSEAST